MSPNRLNQHRTSRRNFTKGSAPVGTSIAVAVSSTGTTNMTLQFARPVVVTGNIGTTVAGLALISQTTITPTKVTQVWSGNVTGLAWTVPAADPNVGAMAGGQLQGQAGTFP